MTTVLTTPARPAVDGGTALRRILLLDAVVSGANGLGYLAAAPLLDDVLGISTGALRPIGALLVAFALVVAVVATRRPIPGAAVRELVVGNVGWVVASLVVAVTGALDANNVGTVWIVLQAAVVAGLAGAQAGALRRRA